MYTNTLVLLSVLCGTAIASSGDRSYNFQNCVNACGTSRCQTSQTSLSLVLRVTRWTCEDDCKYVCMHEKTDRDTKNGALMEQFYGKWPFWRFMGMQEPASVTFSLFNLWCHVRGLANLRRRVPEAHPMRSYYVTWGLCSINAWIWSSVFHTRDLPVTEKLDYFSAALGIVYALYYTVARVFHLYHLPSSQRPSTPWHGMWSFLCASAFLCHITYLSLLPRFDYTYNMAFNLTVGLVHNMLWICYALPNTFLRRFPSREKSYRPRFVNRAAWLVVLTTAATALELRDFPPWGRIIDAHALWHLSTAPLALFWYDFLIEDSLDPSWRELKL